MYCIVLNRDRPIYRPGQIYQADIWVSSIYQYWPKCIGLSRCWQNAVMFLTHPDNLHKKA